MKPETQASIMLAASLACAVTAIWHPWTAFLGAAFAALTNIKYSNLAFACIFLNSIAFVAGGTWWLVRQFT